MSRWKLAAAAITPALLWGCSATPRSLDWIERYGYSESDVIDFAFGEKGLRVPIVTAAVNGRPARLILDTGTNDYAALDEQAFGDLEVSITGWSTFLDSAGNPAGRVPRGRAATLEIGTIRHGDVAIGGMGPESITGKRVGYVGTLGWHSLTGARVTIDYSNRKAAIAGSPLPEAIVSCDTRHVTRFSSPPEIDGLILVPARLDGRDLLVQIDTGKSSTVASPEAIAVGSFEHTDRGIAIDGLTIGPFELQTRFGRVGRGFDSFSEGMELPVLFGLGSDVLAQFLVTIDYASRTVVLERAGC